MQFSVCRQSLDYVTLKHALGADDEGADRGARKKRSGTKSGKSVVVKHQRGRDRGGHDGQDKKKVQNKFPFGEKFQKSWGTERIPKANAAWWSRDTRIYKSKDVPWRMKCKRMVKQIYSVFCFGCQHWSWSRARIDKAAGGETKMMRPLCRF